MVKMYRRNLLISTIAVLALYGYLWAAEPNQPADINDVNKAAPVVEVPPLPFVPGSWTLVVLPDTQHYSEDFPGLFNLQTQWVIDNKDKYNIAYVLQSGDITNKATVAEWERASKAMGRLDRIVPYVIVPGNHDYTRGGQNRSILMNDYFPPSRFAKWPTFGGVMERGHIENCYHLFKAGGQKWLIIGLEWSPRDKTLQWADKILQKYPDRKAIFLTHAYLYSDSTRYDWKEKGKTQKWSPHNYNSAAGASNDGEEIWQKVLKKHKNVFMVLNGHVLNDGLGFLVSTGDQGNQVYQLLADFQTRPVGGGAWLQLLEFLPDGQTIQVKTYSPLYEKYETVPESQLVIKKGQ